MVSKRTLPLGIKNTMFCSSSSSSMDSSIEHAIELNNESAALLCSGDDAKAVSKLSDSLTSMRRLLLVRQHHLEQGSSATTTDGSRAAPASSSNFSRSSSMPVLPSSLQIAGLCDSDFFIFSRCMEIPSFHQRSHKHVSLYSACIVLNLALAHHRLGVKGVNKNQDISLVKAEKMYCMAIQLLNGPPRSSSSCCCSPSSLSDDKSVLSMRIFAVNNLAQVYQEQCRFHKATAVINHLSILLSRVATSSSTGGRNTTTFFHKDELRKMVLNASLWASTQMAPSA